MGRSARLLLGTVCVLFASVAASAQTPIVPTRMHKDVPDTDVEGKTRRLDKVTMPVALGQNPGVERGEHPLAALTRIHQSGDGTRLNNLAVELIETLSCEAEFFDLPDGSGKACPGSRTRRGLNLTADYVSLVWAGADFSGKRTVYRIFARRGLTDPYNATLPGLGAESKDARLYELFLSAEPSAEQASLWVFSRQPDPLEAQAPAFVAAATGPLFSSLAKLTGTFDFRRFSTDVQLKSTEERRVLDRPEPAATVTAQLATLEPPLHRAKVKITDVVRQPVPVSDFLRQTRDLVSRMQFVDVRDAVCAKALAVQLASEAETVAGGAWCTSGGTTEEKCRAAFDEKFRAALKSEGLTCEATVRSEAAAANEARPPDRRLDAKALAADTDKRLDQNEKGMQQVDTELRKLVASQQQERLTADSSVTNTPLTHWTFGALTSFAFQASANQPRVKVGNDGKLVADPLGRQMALVVVNYSPKGYDSERRPMSRSERFRPFLGVVATPEFGVAVGFSIGVWRGVGVNVGKALLLIPSPSGSDQIGLPPSNPTDAFGVGHAYPWFVGASYNFK